MLPIVLKVNGYTGIICHSKSGGGCMVYLKLPNGNDASIKIGNHAKVLTKPKISDLELFTFVVNIIHNSTGSVKAINDIHTQSLGEIV